MRISTDLGRIAPKSIVRYRPISTDSQTPNYQIPTWLKIADVQETSSFDTTVSISTKSGTSQPDVRKTAARIQLQSLPWLWIVMLAMLCTFTILSVIPLLWNWSTILLDDIRYGRPRTMHIETFVGHETGTQPSHFIAMNIDGQAYVFELPGGNTNQTRLFLGPRLTGPDADLAPVTVRFEKRPGQTNPDMIISMKGYEVRYINHEGTFTLEAT